jgi:hypothetical protein
VRAVRLLKCWRRVGLSCCASVSLAAVHDCKLASLQARITIRDVQRSPRTQDVVRKRTTNILSCVHSKHYGRSSNVKCAVFCARTCTHARANAKSVASTGLHFAVKVWRSQGPGVVKAALDGEGKVL